MPPLTGSPQGIASSASPADLLISADSHVVEPRDLWTTRLPVEFRDVVPVLRERREDRQGTTDPVDRLAVLQQDGVSMEILYPTYGLTQFGIENEALQEAICRVYNDWIVEYCSATPGRLVGITSVPTYDIDHAIAELERGLANGLKGCHVWHVPPPHLPFTSDHYDRLWAAAQDLDAPVNLHILSGFSYTHPSNAPQARSGTIESYRGSVELKLLDAVHVLFDFIFYGVLDRFPRLKLVLVEFEIGWIPWLLQQWDYYARRFAKSNPVGLELLPSEYFARQVFATFFNDHVGTHRFQDGWGIDNCMWSNDFPHGNTTWPNFQQIVERDLGTLDVGVRSRLLHENVEALYHLEVPPPIETTLPARASDRAG